MRRILSYGGDPFTPQHGTHVPGRFLRDPAHHRARVLPQRKGEASVEWPAIHDRDEQGLPRQAVAPSGTLAEKINLRRLTSGGLDNSLKTPFLMDKYLLERGGQDGLRLAELRGQRDLLRRHAASRLGDVAGANNQNVAATQGIDRLKMVSVARMIVSKVMYENHIDVLVIPNIPAPNERNQYARDPVTDNVRPNGPSITDLLGVPEVIVPAGYNDVVYEAEYQLSEDTKSYIQVPGTVESKLPTPLPMSMMFWAGPGDEPVVLRVASAYEAATRHRVPPPDFGPLPGEMGE